MCLSCFPLSLTEPLFLPVWAQSTRTADHRSVWASLLLWWDTGTQLVVYPWVQRVHSVLPVLIRTTGDFAITPYCRMVSSSIRRTLHQLPRCWGTNCTCLWHRSLGYGHCCHFLPSPWLQSRHKWPIFVVCIYSNGWYCSMLVPVLLGAQVASWTLPRGVIYTRAMVCVHALESRTVIARGCRVWKHYITVIIM